MGRPKKVKEEGSENLPLKEKPRKPREKKTVENVDLLPPQGEAKKITIEVVKEIFGESTTAEKSLEVSIEPETENVSIEPSLSEIEILENLVYGEEEEKNVLPFPNSELQTQTKNFIIQYAVDVAYLPSEITDAINSLVQDFSVFVTNTNQFHLISGIMQKDLLAVNLLKDWATEEKKNALLKLKQINPPAPPKKIEEPPKSNNPLVPQFTPREPVSTYQHSVATPAPSPSQVAGLAPVRENKDIHYQMLQEASAKIREFDTAQQNWQGEKSQQEVVIDHKKIFADYSTTITNLIKSCWQIGRWGYAPISLVEKLIGEADKKYTYEIINNGDNSFIRITFEGETINSDSFPMR
jgi:hypothetical protein